MIKNIAVSILVMLLASLVSCTGIYRAPFATDIPKAPVQASPTAPATYTPLPMKSVQIASPTRMSPVAASRLSPTLTVTAGSESELTRNCLNIQSGLPLADEYQGKLILVGESSSDVYLYDLQTAQTTKLSNLGKLNIVVTPDGKKYAYHDDKSPLLQIFSSDETLIRSIPWESDWYWMDGWFDGNQIMFEIPKILKNSLGLTETEYPEPLMLLNLATNQRTKLLPNYPGIDMASNSIGWWSGTTVYDGRLSRVVYPGAMEKNASFMGYILWDVPDKKKLTELPAPNFSKEPKWSPDGSKFIVNGDGGEFYLVTRDGVASKITDLNTSYVPLSNNIYNLDSTAYSWSPDNRNVAFWLDSTEPASSTLAVLDTQTEKIVDYCIRAEYGFPTLPVWSPDGKILAIEASTGSDHSGDDTVLVDFERGIAAKITSGLTPIGWLAAP